MMIVKKMKIIVIEDEPVTASLLKEILIKEDFNVDVASTGNIGMEMLNNNDYHVLLLDLNLPDMNGMDILKYLYKNPKYSHIVAIVITQRSEEIDIVVGFEFGADDYLQKPIRKRELIARIKSNIKKKKHLAYFDSQIIIFADNEFNYQNKQLKKDGKVVKLNPKEYALLAFLLSNPNRIFSREEILSKIWSIETAIETRTVDVHIRMLREKIGDREYKFIETIRGMGYKFNL